MGFLTTMAQPAFSLAQPLRLRVIARSGRYPLRCTTPVRDDDPPAIMPRQRAVICSQRSAPPAQPPPKADGSPDVDDTVVENATLLDTSDTKADIMGSSDENQMSAQAGALLAVGSLALLVGGLLAAGGADAGDAVHWAEHAVEEFILGPRFLVSIGMGLSAFVQALTGFGFAIVSVGVMTQLDWIVHSSAFDTVQPVAATLGALTGWSLLLPEVRNVEWRSLRSLLISSSIATPFGIALLEVVDGGLVIRALGALITGYVAYSVAGVKVPKKMGGNAGSWVLGLLAGVLGGAFDITGPPLVVHGEAAEWNSADGTFRRNVLAVVSVNSTLVVLFDAIAGRLNDFYYFDFIKYAAPSVVVGVIIGNWLSSRLDSSSFKKVVLGTCMLLGIKLLIA